MEKMTSDIVLLGDVDPIREGGAYVDLVTGKLVEFIPVTGWGVPPRMVLGYLGGLELHEVEGGLENMAITPEAKARALEAARQYGGGCYERVEDREALALAVEATAAYSGSYTPDGCARKLYTYRVEGMEDAPPADSVDLDGEDAVYRAAGDWLGVAVLGETP